MSWYDSWHNHPFHPHVHWGAFLFICFLSTSSLLGAINHSYADTTTGLVAHYTFDEGSGTTTSDISGNNNTGTLINGVTWVSGQVGTNAVNFDGINDRVTISGNTSVVSPGTGDFTISMWVKWNELPVGNDALVHDAGVSNQNYQIVVSTSNRLVCIFHDGTNVASASTAVGYLTSILGSWRHYVCTRQGSTVTLYDNTTQIATSNNPSLGNVNTNGTWAPTIGSSVGGGGAPVSIDDVRVYNRALTTSDISELYNGGGSQLPPSYSTPPYSTPEDTYQTPTPPPSESAIINALSCSSTDVQTAINSVANGGTVNVPAGSCTWTTPVTVTNKKLNLIGAGIDLTTITSNQPGVSPLQVTTCSASNFFLGSGFSWKLQSAGSSSGIIRVGCNNVSGYPPVAFRITQMKMYGDTLDGVSLGGRFIASSGVYGVIDHVTMISLTSRGAGNISMTPDSSISTSNSYHIPINFGDENALYIEDNVFKWGTNYHGNGGVDMYAGSRYVFRRNTVHNTDVGNHGWDSGNRGTRSFEVYQNTFIADSMFPGFEMFGPRSGTGVLWGNTVKNIQPQASWTGYRTFFTPRYYAAVTPYGIADNVSAATRAAGYYPRAPWGQLPYPGTTGPINDGLGNLVTGSNPIDGNQMGPGHMDPEYTRTVNDLVTTAGSKTITSATANFTASDLPKLVLTSAVKKGRIVTDANWTAGNTTVTSATANFTAGDLGRSIGTPDRVTIPRDTYIASVINPTTAVLTRPAVSTGKGQLWMTDTRFAKIVNSTTATLDTPAIVSATGGTLTIGYTDQGYPLADQPGRGSFPTSNAGNWPNVSTGYSSANYQALVPIYLWGNRWQTVDSNMKILTDTVPPATSPGLPGNEAYIKRHREYYDDPDTSSGTFASLPATCTTGYGYWVTDRGGNWDTANETSNDGALYQCTSQNKWTLYYTPYIYPHPLVTGQTPPPYTTPYPTPYLTPYTTPSPTSYPTPPVSGGDTYNQETGGDEPGESAIYTAGTPTGGEVTGTSLTEETRQALIIQIMLKIISLLTQMIAMIKAQAAAVVMALIPSLR